MNQMLQDSHTDTAQIDTTQTSPPDSVSPRPETDVTDAAPEHPRFTKPQRIAFVQSSWHREVVAECRIAFSNEIEARHIARDRVDVFEVPGSFEIPLHAQLLAKTRRYTAIVAAGLVVDGGIYRHEIVADTVLFERLDRNQAGGLTHLISDAMDQLAACVLSADRDAKARHWIIGVEDRSRDVDSARCRLAERDGAAGALDPLQSCDNLI